MGCHHLLRTTSLEAAKHTRHELPIYFQKFMIICWRQEEAEQALNYGPLFLETLVPHPQGTCLVEIMANVCKNESGNLTCPGMSRLGVFQELKQVCIWEHGRGGFSSSEEPSSGQEGGRWGCFPVVCSGPWCPQDFTETPATHVE